MGPYLVCGTWLLSRLPLERTWSYLDLLGHNWRPAVPKVQDPDKALLNRRKLGAGLLEAS
jgi:hypothetical protein